MLDLDSVADFLVGRGLVHHEEILAGELAVEALARRNRNLLVTTSGSSGLFVKQPDELADSSRATLRAEGEFYARHASRSGGLAASLPGLILFDPAVPVLVLELLPTHRTLADLLLSLRAPEFPIHTWRQLGRRLAEVHVTLRRHARADRPARPSLPWVAHAHEPTPASLATLSRAGLGVLEIVQGSTAITEGLDSLPELWEEETPIHGDIRAENVLLRPGAGAREDIRIVDWELHRPGDRAWDLAGFLEVLAVYWVTSLPGAGEDEVSETIARSALPWAVFHAASRALWEGYLTGCEPWERMDGCKVARFCAARIVQSAVEMTAQLAELPASTVLLLQLCENMFADPARTAHEFFAIG